MALELPMEFKDENEKVTACFDGEVFWYEHPYYPGKIMTIVRVVHDRLLVRMDEKALRTPSGLLWLPPKRVQSSQVGTVLMKTASYWDFFDKRRCSTDEFEIGARVIFRPVSGIPLYYGKTFTVWFFRPGSIMAFLTDGDDLEPHQKPITELAVEDTEYDEIGSDESEGIYSDEDMGITR